MHRRASILFCTAHRSSARLKTENTEKRMTNRRNLITAIILVSLLASLTGCAWWDSLWGKEPRVRQTPEGLYQRGFEYYKKGDYKKAIETFSRVRDEYPLNPVALMAELGIADSYFENEQYVDAEVAYTLQAMPDAEYRITFACRGPDDVAWWPFNSDPPVDIVSGILAEYWGAPRLGPAEVGRGVGLEWGPAPKPVPS